MMREHQNIVKMFKDKNQIKYTGNDKDFTCSHQSLRKREHAYNCFLSMSIINGSYFNLEL